MGSVIRWATTWSRGVVRAAVILMAAVGGAATLATWSFTRDVDASVPPWRPGETTAVVVAELFTSEGCSSCPPADDLLREWTSTQPVAGVTIVGLGLHVDYWNRLGWRDPFSAKAFSQRQYAYDAAVFRDHRVYTPQIVVDGRFQAVGSDPAAVRRAVLDASGLPKATLSLGNVTTEAGKRLGADLRVMVPPNVERRGRTEVMLAVVEEGLATDVGRGENRGRTLRHAAVTRSLTTAAALDPGTTQRTVRIAVPLESAWSVARLRLVAFLQEIESRRILGAAVTPVATPAS